jgi:hypothetical protein
VITSLSIATYTTEPSFEKRTTGFLLSSRFINVTPLNQALNFSKLFSGVDLSIPPLLIDKKSLRH